MSYDPFASHPKASAGRPISAEVSAEIARQVDAEIEASDTVAERRRRDARARYWLERFTHREALSEWLESLVRSEIEADRSVLFVTFTARHVAHAAEIKSAAKLWLHRVERMVFPRRSRGRIFAVIVAQRHASGLWHGHALVFRLPTDFRLYKFKEALERSWPLAEPSDKSLSGATGLRVRLAVAEHGWYVARYVTRETYGGSGEYAAEFYGRLDRPEVECREPPAHVPLDGVAQVEPEPDVPRMRRGPPRTRPWSRRKRMKSTLRGLKLGRRRR